MDKGGYQIIDLKNQNLTKDTTSIKIDGIYNLIKNSIKPILVTGIKINGIEEQEQFIIYTTDAKGSLHFNIKPYAPGTTLEIQIDATDIIYIRGIS